MWARHRVEVGILSTWVWSFRCTSTMPRKFLTSTETSCNTTFILLFISCVDVYTSRAHNMAQPKITRRVHIHSSEENCCA